MKDRQPPENAIDSHLEEIQHVSDFARAMQILAYGIAAIIVVAAGVSLFTADSQVGWWSITKSALPFYFGGILLGYLRTVTLTIVKVVEELRTTV